MTPNANDAISITSAQAGRNTIGGASGGVAFSPLTFSEVATVVLAANANDAGAGNDSLTISSSGMVATGLNRLLYDSGTGANTLLLEGGASRVDSAVALGGTLTTTVQGGAQLTTQHFRQTGLVLTGAGSRATVLVDGTNTGTSVLGSLTVGAGTQFDVTNNVLIVRATAGTKDAIHTQLQSQILSAQNGLDANLVTRWDGSGVASSYARAANVASGFDLTSLGAIRNSDIDVTTGVPGSAYVTFGGQPVGLHDVLVKYTYIGDGNLSGRVSFDDYVGMDNAFFNLIPNLGWATGDVNFNSLINFDDYSRVDQAFFFQGAPLSQAPPSELSGGGSSQFDYEVAVPVAPQLPLDTVLTSGGLLIEGIRYHVSEEVLWRELDEKDVYSDSVWTESEDANKDRVMLDLAINQTGMSQDNTPATGKVRRAAHDLWDVALLEIFGE